MSLVTALTKLIAGQAATKPPVASASAPDEQPPAVATDPATTALPGPDLLAMIAAANLGKAGAALGKRMAEAKADRATVEAAIADAKQIVVMAGHAAAMTGTTAADVAAPLIVAGVSSAEAAQLILSGMVEAQSPDVRGHVGATRPDGAEPAIIDADAIYARRRATMSSGGGKPMNLSPGDFYAERARAMRSA